MRGLSGRGEGEGRMRDGKNRARGWESERMRHSVLD